MKHKAILEYNLKNNAEAATYNIVLNIGNIDQAIRNFKKYLEFTRDGLKSGQEDLNKLSPQQIIDQVSNNFINFFASSGITIG